MKRALVVAVLLLMFQGSQNLHANQQGSSTDVSTVLKSSLASQMGKVSIQSVVLQGMRRIHCGIRR